MCYAMALVRFFLFILLFLSVATPAFAESFLDVKQGSEIYDAVEDLKVRDVITGRPDGTFGPDDFVNRAEAITIVVRAVANAKNLPPLDHCFPDVYGNDWYVKPVCYAKDLGWVSGYPDGTFQPVRTVSKAEFIKILLSAYGIDTDPLAIFDAPLSPDTDIATWYMPHMKYALASSMTSADSFGHLNPSLALTRGQVALLLHRFLLYREGGRAQALLTNAEKDIRRAFLALDAREIQNVQFAARRAQVISWGASVRLPNSTIVQATGSLSELIETLAHAFHLFAVGEAEDALSTAQFSFNQTAEIDAIDDSIMPYTDQVRAYAQWLAKEIRGENK